MDLLSILSPLKLVVAPAKAAIGLARDQTWITLIPNGAFDKDVLPIDHVGVPGRLIFGVSSRSKSLIEVVRVEIDFAAPLHLSNPGNVPFFEVGTSESVELPFRTWWSGSCFVRANLLQTFAVLAGFERGHREQEVQIRIHARTADLRLGGFYVPGRLRVTTFRRRIMLLESEPEGIPVPPKAAFQSPQPYLIQAALTGTGRDLNVVIHEVLEGGATSTERIKHPDGNS